MRQDVGEKFANIVEHSAAFLDRSDDAGEVVVEQHHVGRLAGDVRPAEAHGDADMGIFESRGVLTPSPVTATIWPFCLRAWTIRSFCSALTRANRISGASRANCNWVSDRPRKRSPVMRTGLCDWMRPISHAIAWAMRGWSPVSMMTLTLA